MDPQIGKTYQSNVPINEIREGFYMGETNSNGFIGKSRTKDNIFRIALFGDSYTEGFQLFEPYKFARVLEKSLNEKSEIEVEVLNFGISNVVLPEMYIRKKRLAEKFDIDLYVYVFDSYDFVMEPEGILNSVELIEKNNKLLIVPNTSKQYQFYQKMQFVIDKSSYLNFTLDAYLLIRRGKIMPILFDKFYPPKKINYRKKYSDLQFNNLSTRYLKIISEMEKDKSVFVFRENANKKLKSKLQHYNIPIIETRTALNTLRQKKINPYYWKLTQTKGHLNYEGNSVFGIYLSNQLVPFIKK
ncbi:hypothetical protein [Flavobacterium sp.]|uniref:hypothetical protein n=1 Tax=Flavobacterium sp. TaxID=239 RepID=UPI00286E4F21|nr:hypothetical protein [Flavobacterium sp.]